jgi:hypothetical protein
MYFAGCSAENYRIGLKFDIDLIRIGYTNKKTSVWTAMGQFNSIMLKINIYD